MSGGATKQAVRELVRARMAALGDAAWNRAAEGIAARLLELGAQRGWQAWMVFLPMARAERGRDEVDLTGLVEGLLGAGGVRVCLPRTDWQSMTLEPVAVENLSTDIVVGRYSLREPRADLLPLALGDLDVVIVPGLAFDSTGARLGRGGGLYDRLLARVAGLPAGNRPVSVGVCVDEQVVEKVPVEAHDLRVDMILTPTTILRGA
jgi:5-formyltetrahydrofolate cyclo-ligase